MARKKNKSQNIVVQNQENIEQAENNKIIENATQYAGTVKVTIMHNGKKINTTEYHNNGNTPLFEFLSLCLLGNCSTQKMPKFIRLFNSSNRIPSQSIDTDSAAVGPAFAYNTGGIVTTSDSYAAALHFTIPSTSLSSGSNIIKINQAALYSAENANDKTKYSASLAFAEGSEWKPIIINNLNGDYTLYIEWTLSFKNAA